MTKQFATVLVNVKLPEDIVHKMDTLIEKHEFDTRSSLVRKSVVEFLKNYDQKTIVS
jgi:Arc/MetJ-type ribon-helix-helix transcriptional regulator